MCLSIIVDIRKALTVVCSVSVYQIFVYIEISETTGSVLMIEKSMKGPSGAILPESINILFCRFLGTGKAIKVWF